MLMLFKASKQETGPDFPHERSSRMFPNDSGNVRKRQTEMADRNPSPPRLSAEEIELIQYDNIGETVFSKKWVLSTLMKLVQSVQTSTEGSEDDPDDEQRQQVDREGEAPHELDEAFERELCELWDMSMNAVSSQREKPLLEWRIYSRNLCMWFSVRWNA